MSITPLSIKLNSQSTVNSHPSSNSRSEQEQKLPSDGVSLSSSCYEDSGNDVKASRPKRSRTSSKSPSVVADDRKPSGGAGKVRGRRSDISEDTRDLLKFMENATERNVIVASGTEGNDDIIISMNDRGGLIVTVNEQDTVYESSQIGKLVIDGGAGDDKIVVDKSVTSNVSITGGLGNDTIVSNGSGQLFVVDNYGANDITGGSGNDRLIARGLDREPGSMGNIISGGAGNDYIEGSNASDVLSGDEGYDVIYGLGGDDTIRGGSGNDYLDGGEGNDTIYGDQGDDNLIGGKGDDKLYGGDGDDLLIGASGNDHLEGQTGVNKIISNGSGDDIKGDNNDTIQTIASVDVPDKFAIKADDMDTARIASDLETLAHTEQGQMMFEEIAKTGHTVDIVPTDRGSSCASGEGRLVRGQGADSRIKYNLTKIALGNKALWSERAPIVSMYHEMCHAYNAAIGNMDTKFYEFDGTEVSSTAGTGTKGLEYQAMGVDNPSVEANPRLLTENSLRELFGFAYRDEY